MTKERIILKIQELLDSKRSQRASLNEDSEEFYSLIDECRVLSCAKTYLEESSFQPIPWNQENLKVLVKSILLETSLEVKKDSPEKKVYDKITGMFMRQTKITDFNDYLNNLSHLSMLFNEKGKTIFDFIVNR